MELKVIDIETAKLAKEVGFDHDTEYFYCDDGKCFSHYEPLTNSKIISTSKSENFYFAPTQELLKKFIWEKYGVFVWVEADLGKGNGLIFIVNIDGEVYHKEGDWYHDPEQALEAGLKEALNYLLNKKSRTMSDWKERLLEERLDVSHRVSNLENFMKSDKIDNIDKEQKALLSVQLNAMKTYYQCLEQRIKMLEE